MKKLVSISTIVCLLITSVFTGCSDKDTTSSNIEIQAPSSSESNISNEYNLPTEINTEKQNVASYRYEPVKFEISDSAFFKSSSSSGVFVYNHKCGLINSDGKVILEPIYENLSIPSNGYLLAEQGDGSILIMNEQGIEQTKINHTKALELGSVHPTDIEFVNGYSSLQIKDRDENSPYNVIIDTKGSVLFETNLTGITITDKNVIIGLDYVANR